MNIVLKIFFFKIFIRNVFIERTILKNNYCVFKMGVIIGLLVEVRFCGVFVKFRGIFGFGDWV